MEGNWRLVPVVLRLETRWGMADGREEREEERKRREEEERKDREDRVIRDRRDEWEPERGGS